MGQRVPERAPALIRPQAEKSERLFNVGIFASVFASSRIGQRDEVVLTDTLQDQKHRRRITSVGDEVRALRRDGISLSCRQSHLFLRTLEKDANGPRHDIERAVRQ